MVPASSRSEPEVGTAPPRAAKRRRAWVWVASASAVAAAIAVVLVVLGRGGSASGSALPIEAPGGIVLSQVCLNEAYGITVYYPGDWAVYRDDDSSEESCRYYRSGGFADLSLVEVWASPLEVSVVEDLGEFADVVEFYRRGGFGVAPTLEEQVEVGGHAGSLFDLEMDLAAGTYVMHVYVVPLVGGDDTSLPVIIEAQGELGAPEYDEAVAVADAMATAIRFDDTP